MRKEIQALTEILRETEAPDSNPTLAFGVAGAAFGAIVGGDPIGSLIGCVLALVIRFWVYRSDFSQHFADKI